MMRKFKISHGIYGQDLGIKNPSSKSPQKKSCLGLAYKLNICSYFFEVQVYFSTLSIISFQQKAKKVVSKRYSMHKITKKNNNNNKY